MSRRSQSKPRGIADRGRLAARWWAIIVAMAVLGASCTTDDDRGESPPLFSGTDLVPAGPNASPTPSFDGTPIPATPERLATPIGGPLSTGQDDLARPIGQAEGFETGDSYCRVLFPDGWVAINGERGLSPSGARWSMFGGRLRDEADWNRAVDLFKSSVGATAESVTTSSSDAILVVLDEERGFHFRARFDDRYCDISIVGSNSAPESERAVWDAIIASLSPRAE